MPLMEKVATIEDRMIGQVLGIGSDRQRAMFLDTILTTYYVLLSLVLQHFANTPKNDPRMAAIP